MSQNEMMRSTENLLWEFLTHMHRCDLFFYLRYSNVNIAIINEDSEGFLSSSFGSSTFKDNWVVEKEIFTLLKCYNSNGFNSTVNNCMEDFSWKNIREISVMETTFQALLWHLSINTVLILVSPSEKTSI